MASGLLIYLCQLLHLRPVNTSGVRLVRVLRGEATAAALKLVRTHGEAGSTPGVVGAGIFVRLLLCDGAQPAEPTDSLAACYLSRWAAHLWLRNASYKQETADFWMHKHY